MRTLLLMRHAKSRHHETDANDHDRPLNHRGERDAPRMGELLRKRDLVPDLIVSSTALRARDTAARVAEACGCKRPIELRRELYNCNPQDWVAVLRDLYHDVPRVLGIGHNPTLEELLSELTGVDEEMPTAAIAEIVIAVESWEQLDLRTAATLANLWRPKELD